MYPWSHLLRAAAFFSAMERPGKLGQPRSLATRSSTHPTWPFHTAKCNAFMPISSVEHGFPPVSRSSRRYLRAELEDDERPSPMILAASDCWRRPLQGTRTPGPTRKIPARPRVRLVSLRGRLSQRRAGHGLFAAAAWRWRGRERASERVCGVFAPLRLPTQGETSVRPRRGSMRGGPRG